MKVLQVVHDFPPRAWRGTEVHTLGLSQALMQIGVDVEVIYPVREQGTYSLTRGEFEGLTTWTMDLPTSAELLETVVNKPAAGKIMDLALERGFDLLHVQHPMGFTGEVMFEADHRGVPSVLSLHDFWLICELVTMVTPGENICSGPETEKKCIQCMLEHLMPSVRNKAQIRYIVQYKHIKNQYHRELMNLPRSVIAVSRFVKTTFVNHGFTAPDFKVVGPGINPFDKVDGLPKADTRPVFVYLGNLSPQKGALRLIEAFGSETRAELHLYGRPVKESYFKEVLAAAARNPERVFYRGGYEPDQLGDILAGADVVVAPSLMESYSLVVREALYAGRPVLASMTGGVPEAIDDEVNGLLFDPLNQAELRSKIDRLITEPGLIRYLEMNVRPPATVEQSAVNLLDLYEDVVSGAGVAV